MPVALIAAAAGKNLVIGNKGDLPWHFSEDLKFFKKTTMGHPVLMGRKTYESILRQLGKPLPGRRNLVLTRDPRFRDDRIEKFEDLAGAIGTVPKTDWLFVIGGQQIFELTLPHADKVYLTYIDREYEGDAFFTRLDPAHWTLAQEEKIIEKDTPLFFREYRHK